MLEPTRFDLSQDRSPTAWFNIMPSLVQAGIQPLPPLHPGTKEPVTPDLLAPLFPEALIMQEVATDEWIDIPGGILDVYRLWRPSPLHRAIRLEQALQTPARIYYKYEGVSPAGSHKPNTAVAQAFYNKEAGTKRIASETGAGQWGSALSMACLFFGIGCQVFMVKASYEQKPYRRIFMETFGAEVIPSPSPTTQAGKTILEAHPDSTGSLGIAISEAVEVAATSNGAVKYSLGSVLNHVLLHQTVIGLEAKEQMKLAGESDPHIVIGCVGGGSSYAGLAYPIIPAPESAHGLKAVIEEADAAREADEERVILVNLSGHGYFDMQAYDDYLNGRLPDFEFDPAAEDAAIADLPDAPSLGG